jgi:hypothetical protein
MHICLSLSSVYMNCKTDHVLRQLTSDCQHPLQHLHALLHLKPTSPSGSEGDSPHVSLACMSHTLFLEGPGASVVWKMKEVARARAHAQWHTALR